MTGRLSPLLAALAVACMAASTPAVAQVIAGRVVDASNGAGVPRARVIAAGTDHRESRHTLTGDDGRFSLAVRGGGSYRVRVARTGYEDAATRELAVGAGDTVAVEVRIAAAAYRLDPVVARTPPRRLSIAGVYRQTDVTPSLLAATTTAEGGPRNLTVRGAMLTPSNCWTLGGAADRIGSLVTLNVHARLTAGGCPPGATGASTYKVTLRRIPPGTYVIRVLHTYRDDALPPSLALDTSVTVR